jgi:hypothetical protein
MATEGGKWDPVQGGRKSPLVPICYDLGMTGDDEQPRGSLIQ